MLNVPQFQKAAKDFRAGKLDIQQFTRLVSELAQETPSPRPGQDAAGNGPADARSERNRSEGKVTDSARGDISYRDRTASASATERLNLDLARAARCGFSEVIFSPGKTLADLTQAAQRLLSERQSVLMTRIDPEHAAALQKQFVSAVHNPLGRTLRIAAQTPISPVLLAGRPVAVLTAGTGDIPVAEEACETLLWMGFEPHRVYDVGVAGPQRLLPHVPFLQTCATIVVVAGMEGALPSVVGGHVACPVIAVPTSLGYGAHFQGLVPLLGMINSCAANVVAVNIDAGFKGGYLAGLIASRETASV